MLAAVIGTGVAGLAAIKNLIEEGIDVVAFEKEAQVGGLWVPTSDPTRTSALPETKIVISKHRMCYTDFPHPDSTPIYPESSQIAQYLHSYAQHFNLLPQIQFRTRVSLVHLLPKNDAYDPDKYEITYSRAGEENEPSVIVVDKVVMTIGGLHQPFLPTVEGIEKFEGTILHSQGFKGGEPFEGKNVVVVGSRASAADVFSCLVRRGAGKVYMAHRAGVIVLPRFFRGKPLDRFLSRRSLGIKDTLDLIVPYSSRHVENSMISLVSRLSFKLNKSWNFDPFPDSHATLPTISDELVDMLHSGEITSTPMIASTESPTSLRLTDGTVFENIDAIVFATDWAITQPTLLSDETLARFAPSPTLSTPTPRIDDDFLPLYKSCLSISLPSLVLTLTASSTEGGPTVSDLKAMWFAGVWSGRVPLASEEERWKSYEEDKAWFDGLKKFTVPNVGRLHLGPLLAFYASQIGCEIPEHLSWTSLSAWKWWASGNVGFSKMLLDGVNSPHAYRLWGAKRWEGAREAIEKANRGV